MIENAVKELKQRQQTVHEQIKSLQAEAGRLGKALSVLGQLAEVMTEKVQPPKTKKHKMSAAGRRAIAAAVRARWAKVRTPKEAQAKRPKNKLPLMDVVLGVLEAEQAKSIPEIIVAVNKAGYVSKSKTFATIIGQTLRQAGDKVVRVKRGLYALNG